jgi:tetratricopeptide (TPR) repeat protein
MTAFRFLISNINTLIIFLLVALLPIFFTPFTTEYFDTGKFILLGIAVLLMIFFWGLKLVTESRISIVKTPLDILLLIYLVIAVASTVLSPTPNPALYGVLPKVHGSLLFQIALVLLYFMVVSNLKNIKQVKVVTNLLIFSATIMAIFSLLAYFRIFLPWQFAQNTSFSLAGSPSAGAIVLAILLPVVFSNLIKSSRANANFTPLYFIVLAIYVVTIILVGNLAAWIGGLLATGFSMYEHRLGMAVFGAEAGKRRYAVKGITALLGVVGIVTLVLTILSYTPTLKNATSFGKLAASFSREVQLPLDTSWSISAGAFRDYPILGTGPATFPFNFTAYKPINYNQTANWNLRLNSSHNQYFQTWSEMGGAGILILLLIASTFVFSALKNKRSFSSSNDDLSLGLSGIVFIIVMALSPMTVLTQTVGFLILAVFMASLRGRGEHELSIDLTGTNSYQNRSTHVLIPTLIYLPLLVLTIAGFYFLGKVAIGEYYHRQALNAVNKNDANAVYTNLTKAERANPQADLYRVDLAQTNFTIANSIAAQKGPSEASPGGSLTSEDRTKIQQFLSQAINEGRTAVTLSPRSANNWEVLALLYRQISGVAQDAITFSLDAYGRAIALDPFNPMLRLAVGGVYYQAKNYDLSIRFFDDAVSLKRDFANGLYNLAVALRDKGSTQEAVSVAEKLVAQLQDKPESADYQTASKLLSELRDKLPAKSQATAATPSAALENQELPKVIDEKQLGDTPEKIATPSAITR